MISPNALFTISRVCEMTGLALEEIRRLEEELSGVLKIRRTAAGNRLYTGADIETLRNAGRRPAAGGSDSGLEGAARLAAEVSITASDTLPGASQLDRADAEAIARAAGLASAAAATTGHHGGSSPAETIAFTRDDIATVLRPGSNGNAATTAPAAEIEPLGDSDGSEESLPPAALQAAGMNSADAAETQRFHTTTEEAAAAEEESQVPPLPVAPTLELLLEAAEGLVQENLKLGKAVDLLAGRCEQLETRMGAVEQNGHRRRRFWFFRSA
ncbi:MAG: MerR family transcriptional regulator [Acidobacteriota bacterium]